MKVNIFGGACRAVPRSVYVSITCSPMTTTLTVIGHDGQGCRAAAAWLRSLASDIEDDLLLENARRKPTNLVLANDLGLDTQDGRDTLSEIQATQDAGKV